MNAPTADPRASLPPAGPRARGVGLRAQIGVALATGLGLAVAFVGIAIDRLATDALEGERARAAALAARAAAALIGRADAPPIVVDRAEAALLGRGGVMGIEILDAAGARVEARGATRGIAGEAPLVGGRVRAFVPSARDPSAGDATGRALMRLVVLYAAITSVGILLLCYVLLTRLIVRPVEELTRASERLAAGAPDVRARVHGAAEVQRLALAFNRMSDDLRAERAALQARLRQLEATTRELRLAQDSLVRSEKLASVGRLAAGIAHEIGNPLSAILGLVELVRTGGLDPAEQAEFLRRIQGETERIHRTIRDLLDFARQGGDGGDRHAELAAVVDDAVHLVAPQKDLRRITIERRIPEALPAVRGDPDRLRQVVLNLLLNAADAIEGEGTITIAIAHDETAGQLVLTVDDTGPGIAPEVRGRLFEPFVTTKAPGRGTGLGLAVCGTIVERLGGTIRAEGAPNGGARFVVRLPTAQAAGRESVARA